MIYLIFSISAVVRTKNISLKKLTILLRLAQSNHITCCEGNKVGDMLSNHYLILEKLDLFVSKFLHYVLALNFTKTLIAINHVG